MTSRPELVRIAQPADEPALYAHLVTLHVHNPLGVPMSEAKVRRVAHECCHHENYRLAGVIDGPLGIVASAGVGFGEFWFSDEQYLHETWVYVQPGHRANGYADDLKDFLLWYREQLKSDVDGHLPDLVSSVTSVTRLPAKLRWWGSWARQVGGIFVVSDRTHRV